MEFSLIKLFLLLAIAFVLGVSVGWWLWGRRDNPAHVPISPQRPSPPPRPTPEPAMSHPADSSHSGTRQDSPTATAATAATADDLKRIRGIGPSLERTLNGLGVTRFSQIAGWSEADIVRVDEKLRFRGRIQRDDWQGQARELMAER